MWSYYCHYVSSSSDDAGCRLLYNVHFTSRTIVNVSWCNFGKQFTCLIQAQRHSFSSVCHVSLWWRYRQQVLQEVYQFLHARAKQTTNVVAVGEVTSQTLAIPTMSLQQKHVSDENTRTTNSLVISLRQSSFFFDAFARCTASFLLLLLPPSPPMFKT